MRVYTFTPRLEQCGLGIITWPIRLLFAKINNEELCFNAFQFEKSISLVLNMLRCGAYSTGNLSSDSNMAYCVDKYNIIHGRRSIV